MMEQTLGILGGRGSSGGSGGSSGGGGGLSNESASSAVSQVEKDYMGFSSEGSSYENEAEIELGLGLSLSSGIGVAKNKGSFWGECGRILTAKDLPNGFSGRAAASGVAGTKRTAADCVSPAENGPAASTGVSQVVGWPPIRVYRMNSLVNQSKVPNIEEDKGVGGNEKKENLQKKINCGNHNNDDSTKEKGHLGYIKVNVDGLPIGRKVDLNAHKCYESLAQALEDMFFDSVSTTSSISGEKKQLRQLPKLLDESSEFVLTYKDKEGDWMLVGDVPWRMFLCTVKRLRIMRNSDASGNAPAFQERHERQKGKPI